MGTGKKRILIIDDEVGFARLLKFNLEDTGEYEVRMEHSGTQGLAAARAFRPDAILLDVIMPDMDGGMVAGELSTDEQLKKVPVVFVSAVASRDEAEATHGFISGRPFLAKPITIEAVVQCLKQQLALEHT